MRFGFTLLELVVVISLVGMLTTSMYTSFNTSFNNVGASNELSILQTSIDQTKSLAYSAYSESDPLVDHNFYFYLDDKKLILYENLDANFEFDSNTDRALYQNDLEDPANQLGVGNAKKPNNTNLNFNENDPIVFGLKEGATDCTSRNESALSIELKNKKNNLIVGYLYINPQSCHLEVTQNNLHD